MSTLQLFLSCSELLSSHTTLTVLLEWVHLNPWDRSFLSVPHLYCCVSLSLPLIVSGKMTFHVDRHLSPYFSLSLSVWSFPSRDEFSSLFVAFSKYGQVVAILRNHTRPSSLNSVSTNTEQIQLVCRSIDQK